MALRFEFEPLRGSVLHRSPLPSLENILSELVAEETRLKTSLLPHLQTESVLLATQRSQFRLQSSTRGNQKAAVDECNFFHEKGHWKKDCPKFRNKDKGILPSPHQTSHSHRNVFKPLSFGPILAFSSHSVAASSDRTFNQTAITHEEVQSLVAQQIQQLLGTSLERKSPNSVAMSVANTEDAQPSSPLVHFESASQSDPPATSDDVDPTTSQVDIRYPSCSHNPPSWLADYKTYFSPSFQSFLTLVHSNHEPRSYKEAVVIPHWKDAMDEELNALHRT
ncbi:hypothetical protein RHGRI_008227 [Rhododendron griersonianum]|uniref:Uncharacterized protein n=1 Tax=Rhododendron griersonianum TaxID=479676 RepID=A0AAV6L143_9ERIC|nr:hypothetical protein RHGRI_008227 [Rhododendron griersonianum]